VGSLLRQVPGVNIQEEEGYGRRPHIGLRGTGTERSSKVTVMEDGVLIAPAPYSAPAAYFFPVVGRMEAIEVRKGSSQVKYGPRTVGGAVNLVTASVPSTLRMEWTRRGSGRDGEAGGAGGGFVPPWRLGGGDVPAADRRVQGAGRRGRHGFPGLGNYMAKLRVNTDREAGGAYQELELKLNRYDEVSDETYLGLTDADFQANPLRRYAASQEDVLTRTSPRSSCATSPGPTSGWTSRPSPTATTCSASGTSSRACWAGVWRRCCLSRMRTRGAGGAPRRRQRGRRAAGAGEPSGVLAQGIQSTLGLRFRALGARHDVEVGVRFHEDHEDRVQHEDAYGWPAGGWS
jgi:Fe(3+) dicitrate transport protein